MREQRHRLFVIAREATLQCFLRVVLQPSGSGKIFLG